MLFTKHNCSGSREQSFAFSSTLVDRHLLRHGGCLEYQRIMPIAEKGRTSPGTKNADNGYRPRASNTVTRHPLMVQFTFCGFASGEDSIVGGHHHPF